MRLRSQIMCFPACDQVQLEVAKTSIHVLFETFEIPGEIVSGTGSRHGSRAYDPFCMDVAPRV